MNLDSEGTALLAAVNENLRDRAPRLIYSDWLEENGQLQEALWWRGEAAKSHAMTDFYWDLDDDGNSFGDGYAYAYIDVFGGGDGNGFYFRNGKGDGHQYVDGKGTGNGYENGEGNGHRKGYGEVSGFVEIQKKDAWIQRHREIIEGMPVIGKRMMIWCGEGFAWIGHVDEMYATGCYKLSNAGMLCRTGSDSWMAIASGLARDNYAYRHAPDGIVYTGPELHGAIEWQGELPGRDMR